MSSYDQELHFVERTTSTPGPQKRSYLEKGLYNLIGSFLSISLAYCVVTRSEHRNHKLILRTTGGLRNRISYS